MLFGIFLVFGRSRIVSILIPRALVIFLSVSNFPLINLNILNFFGPYKKIPTYDRNTYDVFDNSHKDIN